MNVTHTLLYTHNVSEPWNPWDEFENNNHALKTFLVIVHTSDPYLWSLFLEFACNSMYKVRFFTIRTSSNQLHQIKFYIFVLLSNLWLIVLLLNVFNFIIKPLRMLFMFYDALKLYPFFSPRISAQTRTNSHYSDD
jgi:hypothetical protein